MQNETVMVDDGFTEAEMAELAADTASNGAPIREPEPAPEQKPQGTDVGEQQQAQEQDHTSLALASLAETQERTAQALENVAKLAAGSAQQQAQQEEEAGQEQELPPTEPDWDAERKALTTKYDDGGLTEEEYELARENLIERKAEWRAEQKVNERLAKDAESRERAEQDRLNQQWNDSLGAFMADANNAKMLSSEHRIAAFNSILATVSRESPALDYPTLLAEAAKRTRVEFNLPDPTAPGTQKQVIQQAVAQRRPPTAPPDLSRAPQAGSGGEGGRDYGDMDMMDISDLEDRLARMSDTEIDRFLETAPGGLLDNPRGGH